MLIFPYVSCMSSLREWQHSLHGKKKISALIYSNGKAVFAQLQYQHWWTWQKESRVIQQKSETWFNFRQDTIQCNLAQHFIAQLKTCIHTFLVDYFATTWTEYLYNVYLIPAIKDNSCRDNCNDRPSNSCVYSQSRVPGLFSSFF